MRTRGIKEARTELAKQGQAGGTQTGEKSHRSRPLSPELLDFSTRKRRLRRPRMITGSPFTDGCAVLMGMPDA